MILYSTLLWVYTQNTLPPRYGLIVMLSLWDMVVYMYMNVHVCEYTLVYVSVHVSECMWVYTYVCVCTCKKCTCTWKYMYVTYEYCSLQVSSRMTLLLAILCLLFQSVAISLRSEFLIYPSVTKFMDLLTNTSTSSLTSALQSMRTMLRLKEHPSWMSSTKCQCLQ